MPKSIIIIGAGLSGLSAGYFAQINGYSSHIFEHSSKSGGVAATWQRGEYIIDGGIHFITDHKPGTKLYDLYRELGISDSAHFRQMDVYGRFHDEESGKSILITADLDGLASDLKAIAPEDAYIIDDLISGANKLRGLDLSGVGMEKPPELLTMIDRLKELWQMRKVFRFFSGKYACSVEEYTESVKSPLIKDFIKSVFLPEVPVWFIMFILAGLADGRTAYLAKGSKDLVSTMERNYNALGGQISFNATVNSILVENNIVTGVRLADGTEYHADYIISTGDGYKTIYELLDGNYTNDSINHRFVTWPISRPFLIISYGVTREFTDYPSFSIIRLENPLKIGTQDIKNLFLRIFNYSPHFAPSGQRVIQVEIETEWNHWNNLHEQDITLYKEEKNRVAADCLERLEKHLPGLAGDVKLVDVATPYTTWRYTLNRKGAWGGWLMSKELFKETIKRTLPGLSNFYLAGQWAMSGGVAPSLYSGRHSVQLICKDDRENRFRSI